MDHIIKEEIREICSRKPTASKNGVIPLGNGVIPLEKNGVIPLEKNGVIPLEKNGVIPLEKNGVIPLEKNGIHCVTNGVRHRDTTAYHHDDAPSPPVQIHDIETPRFIPTKFQLLTDFANLCTLLGAVLAICAMACMWKRKYYLGMFLNVCANLADIMDGPVARATPNRHEIFSVIGDKLDSFSDLVSHFVVPASLLMNMSDLHPICVVLAAFYVCAGILRHSYFEVIERCENNTCIYGVTSDYMVAVYCIAMHMCPLIGFHWMTVALSVTFVLMMFSCLTFTLRSRRFEGFGLFTATVFNVILCASCLTLVFFADDSVFLSTILFVTVLSLAYPLYFRFVELNI